MGSGHLFSKGPRTWSEGNHTEGIHMPRPCSSCRGVFSVRAPWAQSFKNQAGKSRRDDKPPWVGPSHSARDRDLREGHEEGLPVTPWLAFEEPVPWGTVTRTMAGATGGQTQSQGEHSALGPSTLSRPPSPASHPTSTAARHAPWQDQAPRERSREARW